MNSPCRRTFWGTLFGALAGLFGAASHAGAADYGYHRGHNCPRCSRVVLEVWRMNYPRPGFHTHRCGRSTTWYH